MLDDVRPLSSEIRALIERIRAKPEPEPEVIAELARVLRGARVEIHPQLEELRQSTWAPQTTWDRLDARKVSRLAQQPEGWAALGMASAHRNGYVREAAVRALSWRTEGYEVPFLLVRLNDWVPQVRAAALAAASARLTPERADDWIRSLPLVDALRLQRRADHNDFVQSVFGLLSSPEAKPALLRGLSSHHVSTRRLCFRLALDADEEALLPRAVADSDVVVRLGATVRIARIAPGERRRALVDRLCHDASAAVRARSLRLLDGEPEDWRHAHLDKLGCDASALIRATTRRLFDVDWAARYRALVARGEKLRASIAGLGECGGEDDVFVVERFLVHPHVKIRAAALAATAALDTDSVEPFVTMLADASPRISRAAARILESRYRTGLPEMIRSTAERIDVPLYARANALDVIASLRFWPRLLWLLNAAASPCRELAELAAARIKAVTCERPTTVELAAVDRALATSSLPSENVARIRRELAFWR